MGDTGLNDSDESIWQALRDVGHLTPEIERAIIERYGARGERAIKAVKVDRVKRYKDFWVVVGHLDEYIVNEQYCACKDYAYRISRTGGLCWHAIAVRIAEITGQYESYDEYYYEIAGL